MVQCDTRTRTLWTETRSQRSYNLKNLAHTLTESGLCGEYALEEAATTESTKCGGGCRLASKLLSLSVPQTRRLLSQCERSNSGLGKAEGGNGPGVPASIRAGKLAIEARETRSLGRYLSMPMQRVLGEEGPREILIDRGIVRRVCPSYWTTTTQSGQSINIGGKRSIRMSSRSESGSRCVVLRDNPGHGRKVSYQRRLPVVFM